MLFMAQYGTIYYQYRSTHVQDIDEREEEAKKESKKIKKKQKVYIC